MAVTTKVIRVANPRKGRGRFRLRTNRRKTSKRRKLSPKQIKIFGTPQQKAALKRSRKAKRTKNPSSRRRRSSNRRPKVKVIYRTRARKKVRRRRANPGLVVTLGSINPRKRRNKSVAKRTRKRSRRRATNARRHRTRKATNVRRRRRARRTNPKRVYVMNPRRRRSSRRRVTHHRRHRMNSRRRRNPALFGRSSPKDLMTLVGGGLAGVWATKIATSYVTPMVSSIGAASGLGSFMPIIISGVSAWALGFLAGKMNKELGEAVMFGGLMQTGSVALNAFLPSIGSQISLGDLINGNFVVPQNPILMGNQGAISAPAARMSSAYGAAY